VTVSPDSLSAKFIGYVLATPFAVKQFVTKLRYHTDPCWLHCGMATFLAPTSAKGRLAPNACQKTTAQKSSSQNDEGHKKRTELRLYSSKCPVSLVGFSSLSQWFFPLTQMLLPTCVNCKSYRGSTPG